MWRSVWSVWFDTNQGAFAMVLRIFDCDLCMIATLDLLAQPHSSIPYVQMSLLTLWMFFYFSACFECCYIYPQELVTVCRCTALFRCVLVYWCGSAGLGWYPSAGWGTSAPTAPIHQYTPKRSSTPTYSHQLLRMNVITFETCWAIYNNI